MTEDLLKVENFLKFRGCSKDTIKGCPNKANRFLKHYEGKDIQSFKEEDIGDYLMTNYINFIRRS